MSRRFFCFFLGKRSYFPNLNPKNLKIKNSGTERIKYHTKATINDAPNRDQVSLIWDIRDSKVNEKIQAIIPPIKPKIRVLW